ncbi:MAG: CcdB family protein [Trichlorobacter sp.]|uniref:CcdB family protein n=1 Tax=Trichlorobacter sp. TaxID=2911007 RepID=UPI00256E52BE|nr:CcdB family protein [Trichlorobacter sp.]MDK9717706.1 CcdB family protein [Trichlorobacter sp.]
MAQFDVYANPNQATNRTIPYLLDVQADLLSDLATRVVVPLYAATAATKAAQHLNPRFQVKRTSVIMSTAELAGVPLSALGDRVDSWQHHRSEIIAALDFLISGF